MFWIQFFNWHFSGPSDRVLRQRETKSGTFCERDVADAEDDSDWDTDWDEESSGDNEENALGLYYSSYI